MGLVIAEAPAAPVLLAEVKAALRIGTSEEDALLAGFVRAAADTCEAFIGRALLVRAVAETLPAATAWARLALAPVASIEGVAALDSNGEAAVLAAADYAIDIDSAGEGWVRLLQRRDERRVRVSYRAGMAADPNGLPEALRCGIVRFAAHLYAQRDGDGGGPPLAVVALWRPWRRLRLG
jgi:uncharacterized phiE125 gp8 family phage protein